MNINRPREELRGLQLYHEHLSEAMELLCRWHVNCPVILKAMARKLS
jgi:hypothetical protein